MNRLISLLEKENNLSIKRLKQIYRSLCKKTHPDLTGGAAADFIRLRKDYEEAYKILSKGYHIPNDMSQRNRNETPENSEKNPRRAILENLYLYSLKIFTSDGEKLLLKLIELSGSYHQEIKNLLKSYHDVFIRDFQEWKNDGDIFYSHNLFILSVKQLFYYYSNPVPRYKTILVLYLKELQKRAKRLDADKGPVLIDLARWLKDEMDKERIIPDYI